MRPGDLKYVAAPMINQSDLPFRLLARQYGATATYTQMIISTKLLNDQDYLEYYQRDLSIANDGLERPVVVQLCGNDPDIIVQAGRKLQGFCDGIDLNLGCPLEAAKENHYGAYLLGRKDWSLVTDMVSNMSKSIIVPVSAKLRLCQPASTTVELARNIEAAGASWVTLHARTVSARRRRQGAADLGEVKRLKDGLSIPVISNGNVREWNNLQENLQYTGADGLMVGEPLLANPCLFANIIPDPVEISLEYLGLCQKYPQSVTIPIIQTHVRHFVEYQCGRRPWFTKFRASLGRTSTIEEIDTLLRTRVKRWRGAAFSNPTEDGDGDAALVELEEALDGAVLLE